MPPSQRPQFGWKVYGYVLLVLLVAAVLGAALVWARPLWVLEQVTRARLATKGFHGEYVTVGGHRIHYLAGGRGAPVVLVHGLGAEAEYWANLMPLISGGGYRVYALDLLGYGRSDKPVDASYSIAEQADVVNGFLGALQLDHVALGGWSMGGWVAMQAALDAAGRGEPRRIGRLMLFDAAGLRFTPEYDAHLFTPTTPEQLERLYRLLMPNPQAMPSFLVRDMLRRGRTQGWVIERSAGAMFTGRDLEDGKLGALKMPVLIVWGKQDRLLPLATALALHRQMPQSVLEIFDGCGHLAPGQCADRIGPRVVSFLDGRNPQAGATVEIAQRR